MVNLNFKSDFFFENIPGLQTRTGKDRHTHTLTGNKKKRNQKNNVIGCIEPRRIRPILKHFHHELLKLCLMYHVLHDYNVLDVTIYPK